MTAPNMMWVISSKNFPVCNALSSDRTAAKQDAIAVAQRNFQPLRAFAKEDLILLALIPDYPDRKEKEIEVSKESWPLVRAVVRSVTVDLDPGASPMASRLFPTDNPIAAAIDQPFYYCSIDVASRLRVRRRDLTIT